MTKCLIFTRTDGGLTVVVPCISENDPVGFTEAQAVARALSESVPLSAKTNARVIENSDVPSDRTFRDAWKDSGSNIDVDMPKAREIWREKMRLARKPKLEALDVEYQKADEIGDQERKKLIAGLKKLLRDLTDLPAIEAAQTPEELKAIWPEELK